MKINYYFRNKATGNFSIESVFNNVIKEIKEVADCQSFYTKRPIDLLFLFSAIFQKKVDVYHITGAVNYLALVLPGKKLVITIHDIGHYTETLKGWKKWTYGYLFLRIPLKRARYITTISQFTKDEIVKRFHLPEQKVVVIPNPVSNSFKFASYASKETTVILQIGGGRNKNIESLIEAVKGLKVKLLLIRPLSEVIRAKLDQNRISYEFRFPLSEAELIEAYKESEIVYFASTYEGFGLPIIEAMATGRPVITSDIRPMNDVADGNAVLVEPLDCVQIRSAISRLMNDKNYYQTVQAAGLDHVKKFSPERIAAMYYELYCSV